MRIDGYGISLDLPPGWEGQIMGGEHDIPPGAIGTPVVHAGNFPLRPPDDTNAYGTAEVRSMLPGDIFLALLEMDSDWAGDGLYSEKGFPELKPSDFSLATLQVGMPGRVGVQRFVHDASRTFVVYAVVATAGDPSDAEVAGLNSVLGSLSVGPPNPAYYYHAPDPT